MLPTAKLLLLEDDAGYADYITQLLQQIGYTPRDILRCTTTGQLRQADAANISIVLATPSLQGTQPGYLFSLLQKKLPYTPLVWLANEAQKPFVTDTLHRGAEDYLLRSDADAPMLEKTIRYATERRKNANDFRRLFAENPGPMYIFDHETLDFLAVNKAALAQYGYTEEAFLSMNAKDIRPEADLPMFITEQNRIGDTYFDAGQWRHRRSDGSIFYVHIYAHNTIFNGRSAVVALALDVDNKVIAERQNRELNDTIRLQKEQTDKILASIPEVVWSRKADSQQLLYINKASEKVYGYSPDELMGSQGPLLNNIHLDDRERVLAEAARTLQQGKGSCEYRIIHRDGSIRHILDETTLSYTADGAPDIVNGVAVDVTARHQHLQRIEEQNARLREIGWQQSQQVRGPVATILGLIPLFDMQNPANPANTTLLQKIQEAAQLLDTSIKEVVGKTYME